MPYKIAIIGGGAAGMMTAYLLNKAGHRVSVFEKQEILGGHIRTSNKNLKIEGIDKNLFLEGGVIEFPENFRNFKNILEELKVKQISVVTSSGLFSNEGKVRMSLQMIRRNRKGIDKVRAYYDYLSIQISSVFLWLKARKITEAELHNKSLEEVLGSNSGSTWFKNLAMYSYSIPFENISKFPAQLAVPSLREYMMGDWFRIEGGVYTYIEKILETFNGKIHCNADIQGIERTASGILLKREGNMEHYDKVVFAVPPNKVLKLLNDPTSHEIRRFQDWKENSAESIIHSDLGFYKKYRVKYPSEFDFFETSDGWGYNAYLNHLCGINGNIPYNLSYNLKSLIDPNKIIHILKHETPFYQVKSFAYRNEIIKYNGENHTYHAGAYLGDGLHEGAALSAKRIADLIK